MKTFVFNCPTKVIFGYGVIERVGVEAKKLGRRAIIVVGKSWARKSGYLQKVKKLLDEAGVESILFEGIEPNPKVNTVDAASRRCRDEGCDMVIALGGGSVMDAGKGVAIVAASGGSIWDYIYWGPNKVKEPKDALPVIAIPSTAGTGSEADGGAVFTNEKTREKMFVSHFLLNPKTAIIDPSLTLSLTPRLTAQGVVDMFSQVLEPYIVSEESFLISDRFAESLLSSIKEAGLRAVEDGQDREARGILAWASTLSMWNIHKAGRGSNFSLHWIEHVVSGVTDCSHGAGLAALLPSWLEEMYTFEKERMEKLGLSLFGRKDLIDEVTEWLLKLNLYPSLRDFGISEGDLEFLARETIRLYGWSEGKLPGPFPLGYENVLRILKGSLR
jgi:alcohol dehydrogenase YqhD (iron-dependent ADH family)